MPAFHQERNELLTDISGAAGDENKMAHEQRFRGQVAQSNSRCVTQQVCDKSLAAISQIGAGRVAGRFLTWARHDDDLRLLISAVAKRNCCAIRDRENGLSRHSQDSKEISSQWK
jgi:hypothetical protein